MRVLRSRRLVSLALLLTVVVAAGCAKKAPPPPAENPVNVVRRISNADVQARVAAGKPVLFLDVRDRTMGPVIKDAVNVPHSRLKSWAKDTPRDTFIVAYCACLHEASAAHAVLELQQVGYTNAYALLDGYQGWVKAGLPTEQR
jgi:rhodanese-related sulfurtransferase